MRVYMVGSIVIWVNRKCPRIDYTSPQGHCKKMKYDKESTLFAESASFIIYYFAYTNILVPTGKLVGAGSDEPLPFIFTKSILVTPVK